MGDFPRLAGFLFSAEKSRKSSRKFPDPWPGLSLENATSTPLGKRPESRSMDGLSYWMVGGCTSELTWSNNRSKVVEKSLTRCRSVVQSGPHSSDRCSEAVGKFLGWRSPQQSLDTFCVAISGPFSGLKNGTTRRLENRRNGEGRMDQARTPGKEREQLMRDDCR